MHLSHLQYINDTLVFSPNDFHSISTAKRILRLFKLALGLKVNFNRSSLVGINLDDEYTDGMANAIYYKWNSLSIQYLGLPLGANPKWLSTWKLIINSFHTRLGLWIGHLLSKAGKGCLIKIILSSLPLYYMSFFLCQRELLGLLLQLRGDSCGVGI